MTYLERLVAFFITMGIFCGIMVISKWLIDTGYMTHVICFLVGAVVATVLLAADYIFPKVITIIDDGK